MEALHKRTFEDGLRLKIDDPEDRRITRPAGFIRGWFAGGESDIPESFDFRIGGIILPHSVVNREDVEDAMPGRPIVGFDIRYDLIAYLPYINDNRLLIHLKLPGYDPVQLSFQVAEGALASCLEEAGGV